MSDVPKTYAVMVLIHPVTLCASCYALESMILDTVALKEKYHR